ncbi:MAG: hypothetical protein QG625_1913 [Cyanobacteriota bacterium erpe_2018_sw_39hr_WHONDRS-SW48-000098_B_bin.30]|nr:hypothetical protein [Cyanobacteriota bacterium erpe_2018_sw_39hr_WHONDRS-SW48-000098_B_bin.30]
MAQPEATTIQAPTDGRALTDKPESQSRQAAENLLQSAQPESSKDIAKERSYWSGFVKAGSSEHLQEINIDFGPQKSERALTQDAQRLSNVASRIEVREPRRPEPITRLNPDMTVPQAETRPESGPADRAPGAGENSRNYAPGLQRGEGPYQALRRMGMDHEEAARNARRINRESGQGSYRQGDQFSLNPDGSVSIRQNSRTAPGSYTETTRSEGRTTARRETDAQGNFNESSFDREGRVTGERSRTRDAQGNVTDKNRDQTGTTTDRFDPQGRQRSHERQNNDGSANGWSINQDGSRTDFVQRDQNHRQETTTRDGRIVSESRVETTPQGEVRVQRQYDQNGGYSEVGQGPRAEHQYTRTDDGRGNINYQRQDGVGYTRTQGESGAYGERYRFADGTQNYSRDVSAEGKIVFTDSVGLKAEVFGGSQEFQQRAWDQIRQLPEAHRQLLATQGNRFALGGRVSDVDPSLRDVQPRGWPEGRTWDDADGAYMSGTKQIVVAESTRSGPSERIDGVVRHEAGHAMDWALDRFSSSDEFKRAYKEDTDRFNEAQRREHRYLLQSNNAGRQETAAEVYAALQGASANPHHTEEILRDFPATAALMRRRLAQVRPA